MTAGKFPDERIDAVAAVMCLQEGMGDFDDVTGAEKRRLRDEARQLLELLAAAGAFNHIN